MVTPVNSEKSVTLGPNQTQTREGMTREQTHSQEGDSPTARISESDPDVASARQMYQLESHRLETASARIDTPEQARTLLDQLLQQFSVAPEAALKAQGNGPSQWLDKLLSAAPS